MLSNTRLDCKDEDRGNAPKANALVLSLNRISEDRKLSGNITATYLAEEDSVLGTGGVGGLHFTDVFTPMPLTSPTVSKSVMGVVLMCRNRRRDFHLHPYAIKWSIVGHWPVL